MVEAAKRPEALAFAHHGQPVEHHVPVCPPGFTERASLSMNGMGAGGAIIATFGVASDLEGWPAELANISASSLVTPVGLSWQGASPRLVRRLSDTRKQLFPA